ncbi:helix-turn-helix transcriptional regulator [Asticcacaulis sp. 201]|uniref:helix-turn-helix transcriptional regulator n=1 Tax=Asticcacaulis sp. 201 TaxID=3028787 RepID=UPI0029169BDE|nr:autoinducer binding domain-containing protein [Asticcacaulis sp. 201]MDV6330938.1 autoinducer binding domain-containing protein [Asticcacaulis sp. 201]
MPSYVRSRLLNAREFTQAELFHLKQNDPVFRSTVIEDLRSVMKFEHYLFAGIDLQSCEADKGFVLETDMPRALTDSYQQQQLFDVDPLMKGLSADRPTLSWFDIPDAAAEAATVKPLMTLLDLYAIAPRTVVSFWNDKNQLYGCAIFTRSSRFNAHERSLLQWTGKRLHDDMSKPILKAFNAQVGLNANESRCLQLASFGMTSEEIGLEMGFPTETINTYIKLATRKLGSKNRSQAVADALRLGIIQ